MKKLFFGVLCAMFMVSAASAVMADENAVKMMEKEKNSDQMMAQDTNATQNIDENSTKN
ncbi:MAG: hypothetical protein ACTTIM_00140 [Campylobacter sp.]